MWREQLRRFDSEQMAARFAVAGAWLRGAPASRGQGRARRGRRRSLEGLARAVVSCAVALACGFSPGVSAASRTRIETLTRGAFSIDVVRRDELWSIYVDEVTVSDVLDLLQRVDGPTYSARNPLTRAVRLSLHRVPIEEIIEKLFLGQSYSLHYEGSCLSHVRVLHEVPGFIYSVPRASESRGRWEEVELADAEEARGRRGDDSSSRGGRADGAGRRRSESKPRRDAMH